LPPSGGRPALTDHHRFMLRLYLGQYDALAGAIGELDQKIDAAIEQMDAEVVAGQATFCSLIGLLCTIPGVGELAATTILAEIGADMGHFPTSGHLLSWAGLCPGQNESAGKRRSSRLRKGAPLLKTTMVQCAWAATNKKDSYYRAQYNRLRGKHGKEKAVCAVAASMLTAIYHMLKDGTHHEDLGVNHFEHRSTEIRAKKLAAQIAKLGFQVELRPIANAA
jgi:transposase